MLSKIVKFFSICLVFLFFLFGLTHFAKAEEKAFINLVNPVRGRDFWGLEKQDPLTAVKDQLKIIQDNHLPATWLLRPDTFGDEPIKDFFKNVPKDQELGLFLEVTPSWASKAEVDYHQEALWHYANAVFLSGYTLEERTKLINTAFEKFKEVFGDYPQSVGAWHLDAYSLAFMEEKYGVKAALICADQFQTDDYQIWGSWWGVPYYPSRDNALLPAQSEKNKMNLVVVQWAARDPLHGYGGGLWESTFSLQANDYLKHGLGTDYFSWLVDLYLFPSHGEFGQIVVGLENDNHWEFVSQEYEKEIKTLIIKKAEFVQLKDFADWYQKQFPRLSPTHQISGVDFFGSGQKAFWLMSVNGRLGIIEKDGQKTIRDWRLYQEGWAEPYLQVANQEHQLKLSLPAKIDSVRFPEQEEILKGDPEELLEVKNKLPFETPKVVFALMAILFLGFLIFTLRLSKWLGLLMFLGLITWGITMVKSGLLFSFGMGFWGPNGHDGVWHLALINELTRHFPPQNMIFAHLSLTNYHFGFDWLVALVHQLTSIPVVNLYFQIFPLILTGFLGLLVYLLIKKWTGNILSALLAVFFTFFGGSFGWLVTLFKGQGIGGESLFWANQSISTLINPPFAFSLILILTGLFLFLDYQQKPTVKKLIIISLAFGLIIGFKAYAGVVILFGLGFASFWEWLFQKKFLTLKIFLGSLLVSLVVFLPQNQGAASLFVWAPFWFPHTMLAFSDRLGWIRLDQARQAYLATGQGLKWFLAEGLALLIFLVGNLGTRILAGFKVFSWFRKIKKIDSLQALWLGCLFSSVLLPLLFIQKGNPWNSLQFFYYFLFFCGVLAALTLGEFLAKKKFWVKLVIIFIVIALTLPTTWGTLKHYWPLRAPARIGFEELEALEFLKEQPWGIVLAYPHDYSLREKTESPKPLYTYETTAYLSAFGEKTSFLEDEMNLEIMQVDWRGRRMETEQFFQSNDTVWAREFLQGNQIRYLYLLEGQSLKTNPEELELVKIFENGFVKIYEFRGKI